MTVLLVDEVKPSRHRERERERVRQVQICTLTVLQSFVHTKCDSFVKPEREIQIQKVGVKVEFWKFVGHSLRKV